MRVPDLAEFAHRRDLRETLAETLHPTALVIHRDQQRRRAQRMDRGGQFGQLAGRSIVAREQDHPADQRMAQARFVFGGQLRTQHIQHHRTQS